MLPKCTDVQQARDIPLRSYPCMRATRDASVNIPIKSPVVNPALQISAIMEAYGCISQAMLRMSFRDRRWPAREKSEIGG